MIRSHKIRLRPTEEQKQHLMRAFAASRDAWNWGKEILDFEYDLNLELFHNYNIPTTGFTHHYNLKKAYNAIKPDWVKDKTASATQEAFNDLGRAIRRYWDIRTGKVKINGHNGKPRKDRRQLGWLNWRSKKFHNSFRVTNVYLKFDGPNIRYNARIGFIRMCEDLRFDGKIMNATFSWDGRWFWVSIQVEIERPEIEPNKRVAGVDLGIKYLAVTSDGEITENPKSFYQLQAKLRRLQRKLDRQRRANNPDCYNADGTFTRGKQAKNKSNRMERTQAEITKLHTRIRNIRRNAQHHLTAGVAKNYGLIIIEDLNVNGMLKNGKLAKAISDAGFSEIRRQFEYKADYFSGMVGVVDQWFPSSKLCSGCKEKKLDLDLSDREWICEYCGQHNERDLNAAINLRDEGIRIFVNPNNNRPQVRG